VPEIRFAAGDGGGAVLFRRADQLRREGVQYQASMLHSKTMLVDDFMGIIGTANFDNRSFRLNYEVCAIAYGEAFNGNWPASSRKI
jgi:phosphatidylserine/phosphatidylglycerophosphate/cardiolipin synthase-like enzyme